ncbi:MAG TPA: glycosyltransferase family 4 protein [Xanthobacteraceae bacterium]|jgi:glycosyltransferase involved in cell wall biosynthesis
MFAPPSGDRIRVLIVAANASAQWGGEAVIPLHIFRGLRAAGHDAWLCVGSETKAELDELLGPDRLRVVYVEDARKHAFFRWLDAHSPQWVAPRYTYYYLSTLSTLLAQRSTVLWLIGSLGIQIVHQPTPVSPKSPSFLFGLPVPLVVGPMNGGMEYPPGFRFMEVRAVRWVRSAGRLLAGAINWLAPGKLHAARLLVANERTARALPAGVSGIITQMAENGIEFGQWSRSLSEAPSEGNASFRLIFIGRLEAWKGAQWLLEGFARAANRIDCRLTIVGEFKDALQRLENEARRLGIASRVEFVGWQPQARCAQLLAEADALALPSVFECGGAVVLEAMASARPVIAVDWGGPGDYLTPECGVLLPATDPARLVHDIEKTIVELGKDRDRCRRMGLAGRARVIAEYTWPARIDHLVSIYREVLALYPAQVRSRLAFRPSRKPEAEKQKTSENSPHQFAKPGPK